MKKIILSLILCSVVLLNAKTWVREYTYQASEADSKLTSRAISLEQVKRLLLQEIGVYVHSTVLSGEIEVSGEVKELTAKQIEIISAGITETKILEEDWNGETYYIKAEITADENDVIKRLDKVINDKEKTKQLEDSRKKTEEALLEIERLKQQLAQTKDEDEKLQIQNTYNQSSNQLTAEDWFQKGYNAYDIGDYDNAILYYNKAIKLAPEYISLYNNLGVVYDSKNFYDKAIEVYYEGIRIDSTDYDLFVNLANAYAQKGNQDKAVKYFTKAIEINPENELAYCNLGLAYAKNNDYFKALINYNKAIIIKPDFEYVYNLIGILYMNEKKYDKAIEYYQKATKIDPNYAYAHHNLGNVFHENGNIDKAIECWEKVILLNPNQEEAYSNLGIVFKSLKKFNEAIKCFEKLIKINPINSFAYREIGTIYGNDLGNYSKSMIYIKQAARLGDKESQDVLKQCGMKWE